MKTKQSEWMKGLLYAESERKRLESKGCNKREIDSHLLMLQKLEEREPLYDKDWIQGLDDYRNAYLRGEIV